MPATKKKEEKKKITAKKPTKRIHKKVEKVSVAKSPQAESPSLETVEKYSGRQYIQTIGRHKSAVAITRLYKSGKGNIIVNNREIDKYFPTLELKKVVRDPVIAAGQEGKLDFTIKINGGGTRGQALAARLGVARALVEMNSELKKTLKKPGYLTRDSRKKERKKFGLKGARRAPQWSKR